MAKGFGGMPGNMQGLMQQAKKMQEQLQKLQEDSHTITAEGSAGGGMVKAVVNGKQELMSIAIDPQVVNPTDVEMLQDLVVAAVNDASRKAGEQVKEKMGGITGGLNIPGLF